MEHFRPEIISPPPSLGESMGRMLAEGMTLEQLVGFMMHEIKTRTDIPVMEEGQVKSQLIEAVQPLFMNFLHAPKESASPAEKENASFQGEKSALQRITEPEKPKPVEALVSPDTAEQAAVLGNHLADIITNVVHQREGAPNTTEVHQHETARDTATLPDVSFPQTMEEILREPEFSNAAYIARRIAEDAQTLASRGKNTRGGSSIDTQQLERQVQEILDTHTGLELLDALVQLRMQTALTSRTDTATPQQETSSDADMFDFDFGDDFGEGEDQTRAAA